jgi:hypothetical protein
LPIRIMLRSNGFGRKIPKTDTSQRIDYAGIFDA